MSLKAWLTRQTTSVDKGNEEDETKKKTKKETPSEQLGVPPVSLKDRLKTQTKPQPSAAAPGSLKDRLKLQAQQAGPTPSAATAHSLAEAKSGGSNGTGRRRSSSSGSSSDGDTAEAAKKQTPKPHKPHRKLESKLEDNGPISASPRASSTTSSSASPAATPQRAAQQQPPPLPREPIPPFVHFAVKHRKSVMEKNPKLTYLAANKVLRDMYMKQPAAVRQPLEDTYQQELTAWRRQQQRKKKKAAGAEGDEKKGDASGAMDEESDHEVDVLVESDDGADDDADSRDTHATRKDTGRKAAAAAAAKTQQASKRKATSKAKPAAKGARASAEKAANSDDAGKKAKRKPAAKKKGQDKAKKAKTLDSFLRPRDPTQPVSFPERTEKLSLRQKKFLSKAEREQLARERAEEKERKKLERKKKLAAQRRAKEEEARRKKQEKSAEPLNDEDFKHNRSLPRGRRTPTRFQGDAFTHAMMVLEFVTNFSKGLPSADHVKSLSIESLEAALFNTDDPTPANAILANILIALLEIDDGPCATNVDIGCGIDVADLPLNKETASEVLRRYLLAMPSEYIPWQPDGITQILADGDFAMLSPNQKIKVLAFLCDQHMDNDHVVEVLEDAQEKITAQKRKRFYLQRERAAAARTLKDLKSGKAQVESDEALARRLAGLSNTRSTPSSEAEKALTKLEDDLHNAETKLADLQFAWGPRCVGRDRDFNSYFVFTCMHGLYRRSAHTTMRTDEDDGHGHGHGHGDVWRVYITRAELDELLETLDPRGRREKQLKTAVGAILSKEYLTCLSHADLNQVTSNNNDDGDDDEDRIAAAPLQDAAAIEEKLLEQTRDDVRDTFTSLVEQGIDSVVDVGDKITEAQTYADLASCIHTMLQRLDDTWLQEPIGSASDKLELFESFPRMCEECTSASQVQVLNHLLYNSIKWDAASTQRRSARLQRYPSHEPRRTTRRAAAVASARQRAMIEAWDHDDDEEEEEDEEEEDTEEEESSGSSGSDDDDEEESNDGRRRSSRTSSRSSRRRTFSPPREIQGVAVNTSHTASSSRGGRAVKEMQCCEAILKSLRKCEHAWPFLTPVTEKEDPDYVKHVQNPMDFQTIMTQLDARQYVNAQTFAVDVQRVVDCSLGYYLPETEEYAAALAIEKEFHRLWKEAFGERQPLPQTSVPDRTLPEDQSDST
ncbi:hypothetical protein PTSG_05057 [Salpingoeca rosetta]|uniref:Bromo domain-containing protein n=1 Tax=Salpingoeca rosetta (strain ATCC 50818 / BSB-021) TaxID=946362 RepID=F2U9E2_SALR5|nr:uncharacterized protein PTSG_05057 [Salpingoeca rosetta]EGD73345.1 hypothetical protein PTSG_05057 [Salpingoeca rosetta]|eukprot:XP_004994375.1 hypothetical protein PTSG_05057 [Salpingoeca rosetta]